MSDAVKQGSRKTGFKARDILLLVNALVPGIAASFKKHIGPLVTRVKDLEKTVAELQATQSKSLADFYKGVWQPAGRYDRGDIVTWQGGMWIAVRSTYTKPGDGDSGWQLAVKAGRDARGA